MCQSKGHSLFFTHLPLCEVKACSLMSDTISTAAPQPNEQETSAGTSSNTLLYPQLDVFHPRGSREPLSHQWIISSCRLHGPQLTSQLPSPTGTSVQDVTVLLASAVSFRVKPAPDQHGLWCSTASELIWSCYL